MSNERDPACILHTNTTNNQPLQEVQKERADTRTRTAHRMSSRFSSIHDAASYVNEELHRRALLPASQKLRFRSTDDKALQPQLASVNNDKLVINTIHKLLKALDRAELASETDSIETPELPSPKPKPAPARISPYKTKVVKPTSRHTLASLRRYEVTIEQLRDKLRLDGPDLTWQISPLPEPSVHVTSDDSSRDQDAGTVSVLLRKLIAHRAGSEKVLAAVTEFLQASNSFLYTRCVHNCECSVPPPIAIAPTQENATEQDSAEPAELEEHLSKLQELVDDWHDIAQLL
ncbi:LAQU0S06e01288g1_1 [Lachancea quebecensis]|uniref:LAQU0S06e01288g1_1 n=1 Tax=Lachancea quebecensis TaxID=1654605 RepID=A0A0P1KS83_9SACH|nr:LAQU0S06e01288g1_1 [Lachancea quebecensis]